MLCRNHPWRQLDTVQEKEAGICEECLQKEALTLKLSMWEICQGLAEVWTINKKRALTEKEMELMTKLLEANAMKVWDMAKYQNLSLMASMTNDTQWQHEICAEIDRIDLDD